MNSNIKLWAKFRLVADEHISITYTPVIGWERQEEGVYIAIVLRQPSMHDSDTAYAVDNAVVRQDYGRLESFVREENLQEAIENSQVWVNKDEENRSLYVYPKF